MQKACIQTSEILETCLPNSRWSHTAAANTDESGMSELVHTGNQQSNKGVDWQKVAYFMYFENTKIKCIVNTKYIRFFKWYLNAKYKIGFCISNTYIKNMYFKYNNINSSLF